MPQKPTTRNAIAELLLHEGAMSAKDIADALGKPRGTINSCLNCARRPGKRTFRVVRWERSLLIGGRLVPLYDVGSGPDVPCPPPLSKEEIQRRWRAKNGHLSNMRAKQRRGTFKQWEGMFGQLLAN